MSTRSTEPSTYRNLTESQNQPPYNHSQHQSYSTSLRPSRHRNPVSATAAHGGVLDFREAHQQRVAQRREEIAQRNARRRVERQEVTTAHAEPYSAGDAGSRLASAEAASSTGAEHTVNIEAQRRDERRAQRVARYEEKQRRDEKRRSRLATRRAQCPACHWGLFVLTTLLALLSIPIVYSASTPIALAENHSANFYFIRQIVFVAVGYGAFLLISRFNQRQMRVVVWGLYVVALLGLLAIDFTPLGFTQSGVRRWIKFPGLPPQQFSELAKIALIGVMADFWSRVAVTARNASWPWLAAGALTLPMVGLVLIQPHLSAALLLFCLPLFIAFYAGISFRQFAVIMVPLVLCGITIAGLGKVHVKLLPYQQDRIAAHFGAKGKDAQGSNYQKDQSTRTLISGSLFGRGPGGSLAKQGHLPEAHTDFIFSVIGEEWGLAGTLGLMFAYATMVFFCFHIGHCAETAFESLLCAGVGTLLAIQVSCNVGVTTGVLPVTGMPLPFMSYGGSSLLCVLIGIAIVLSVSRQTSRSAQAAQAALAAAARIEPAQADLVDSAPASHTVFDRQLAARKPVRTPAGRSGAVA